MRTKWFVGCLLGLLLLSVVPSPKGTEAAEPKDKAKAGTKTDATMRKWTLDDNKKYEARFVSIEHRVNPNGVPVNIVTLEQADGTKVTVRPNRLCQDDKDYLRELLVSQGKTVPPTLRPAKPPEPAPAGKPQTEAAATKPTGDTAGRRTISDLDAIALKERLEKMKDANSLLRRILKGFPANCVIAQVVGQPKPIKYDEDKHRVTVRVLVKLGVDETALAAFRKRLLTVLEEFKEEEDWDESWTFEPLRERSSEAKKGVVQPDTEFVRVKANENDRKAGQAVTGEIVVYVNTERGDAWTSLKWKAFALDQMLANVFDDSTGRHGECVLSVVSKAGDTIPLDRFPLDDERLGGNTPIADRATYGDAGRTFFISSTFLRDAACSRHAPTVTIVRDIEMDESLLDRLQALKCETRFVTGDKGGK